MYLFSTAKEATAKTYGTDCDRRKYCVRGIIGHGFLIIIIIIPV